MPSKNPENTSFSLADFEKGLVLAGLLTPRTVQEIEELELLQAFENEAKKISPAKKPVAIKKEATKNIYFKRVVLAAEIVSALHAEPTFGRVKFQKLVYLCEHRAALRVHQRYHKLAAGPFDHKFMHTIEREFEKQKWFRVDKIKTDHFTRSKYIPLPGCDGYKKYYSSYFSHRDPVIQEIIELFRKKNTDFAEISATLFACYQEILDKELIFNEDELLSLFYDWSEQKGRFEKRAVLDNWQWLQDNGLVTL